MRPRVNSHVFEGNTAALEFRELSERKDDDLIIEVLFDDHIFVVAGANSPWARRRKIALADLAQESWILAPQNNVVRSLLVEAFLARRLPAPTVKVVSNSMHIRMHLLATGRFLTVLAGSLLHHNADRWSLKALPVDFGVQSLPVAVARLKNRTLSPVVQLFIEHARQVMRPKLRGEKRNHFRRANQ